MNSLSVFTLGEASLQHSGNFILRRFAVAIVIHLISYEIASYEHANNVIQKLILIIAHSFHLSPKYALITGLSYSRDRLHAI